MKESKRYHDAHDVKKGIFGSIPGGHRVVSEGGSRSSPFWFQPIFDDSFAYLHSENHTNGTSAGPSGRDPSCSPFGVVPTKLDRLIAKSRPTIAARLSEADESASTFLERGARLASELGINIVVDMGTCKSGKTVEYESSRQEYLKSLDRRIVRSAEIIAICDQPIGIAEERQRRLERLL